MVDSVIDTDGDGSGEDRVTNRRCTYELTWDERPTPAPAAFVTDPESTFVRTAQRALSDALGGEPVGFALGVPSASHTSQLYTILLQQLNSICCTSVALLSSCVYDLRLQRAASPTRITSRLMAAPLWTGVTRLL